MYSYEEIMGRALSLLPQDVDKREGSIIYDAIAPCALELAQAYSQLKYFLDLAMPDTSEGDYLDRIVLGYGVDRKQATKALRGIISNKSIPIGSRWTIQGITYVILALNVLSGGVYEYVGECLTSGDIGNTYEGLLTSLDGISGIECQLTSIISPGAEKELDDILRERLYHKVRKPATSGNIHHYQAWATEVEGVGGAKIFPLWDGPGTVKVMVVDANKLPATAELVNKVGTYIETVRPIGASVTVSAPNPKLLNIRACVSLDGSKSLEDVKNEYSKKVLEYINSITFKKSMVSYALLGSILLDVPGVLDYSEFLLNGAVANMGLAIDEVPNLGTITLKGV